MALVSHRSRERARRRRSRNQRLLVGVGSGLVFLAIGLLAYVTGKTLAESSLTRVQADLVEVTRERNSIRDTRDAMQAQLTQANRRIAALQEQYDASVPKGAMANLLAIVNERVADGTAPDRLIEALRQVRPVSPCEGKPVTRRFAIRPGTQPIQDDTASFADGLISITVSPTVALTPDDPLRSLTAKLTHFGTDAITVSGPLPLFTTMLIGNAEFRFTIAASDIRGFVTATANGCGK